MIRIDVATVLLQWAAGGLLFLWVTTRRREVGIGYGWLLRGVYGAMAAGAAWCGFRFGSVPVREASSIAVAAAAVVALGVSVIRRRAGVSGFDAEHDRRTERVAQMTGIDRMTGMATATIAAEREQRPGGPEKDADGHGGREARAREFPPALDLAAPLLAVAGLVAGALDAGGNPFVSMLRTFVGAAFLGAVTDAMLLGHWYLVQPGLPRRHLNELVRLVGVVWPAEVIVMLLPTGMFSVWSGEVDDGWNGTLGWFWAACAITTIVLVFVTRAALRERYYSAVMAATGLLYLAILTAFGTDLVARAVLAG